MTNDRWEMTPFEVITITGNQWADLAIGVLTVLLFALAAWIRGDRPGAP